MPARSQPAVLGTALMHVAAATSCGLSNHTLTVGTWSRTFLIHTPASACDATGNSNGATAPAVVLCLHGWYDSAEWACNAMCAPYAESHGFIAVCPQGTSEGR